MIPIWKDKIVTLASSVAPGASVLYRIRAWSSETIYQGRAYAAPGIGSDITVRVNDICADYLLKNDGWAIDAGHPYGYRSCYVTFTVQKWNTGTSSWDSIATFDFVPDWSYEDGYNPSNAGCNFPISDILIPGQLLPGSAVGGSVTVTIYNATATGDFNADFNADFLLLGETESTVEWSGANEGHAHWLNLRNSPHAVKVTFDGRTWRVGGGCHQYALYYINAYGYWDTLAVQANTDEQDAVTRHTYERDYVNTQTYARGKWNNVNELKHTYTFHTHPLTEDKSLLMHHLLNSPLVYLHDVTANKIRPIVLTDTTTDYKKGCKLFTYSFKAELAQERIRR